MRIARLVIACLVVAIGPIAGAARADEITDALDQALGAYRRQDFGATSAAIETATALLRQKRAESWKALLPPPLPGWTAEDAETTSLSPALLGGVTTASRAYRRDGARVEISIIADSPILQGIGAMVSNLLSTGVGTRTLVIGGRRLTYMQADNSFTAMVGDRVMVKMTADAGTPDDAVRQYVAEIDFAGIERAGR